MPILNMIGTASGTGGANGAGAIVGTVSAVGTAAGRGGTAAAVSAVLAYFTPAFHPDFGMKRNLKPRVLKAQFGDGYLQRAADGMNTMPVTLSLQWTNLILSERDYIINFLAARKGYQSFFYTYQDESVAKVYVCEEWDWVHNDAYTYTVAANFMQVFDI